MKKTLLFIVVLFFSSRIWAQQTIHHVLTLSSNGVNSTEILFRKQNNIDYYSLAADIGGFGIYNVNTAKHLLFADANDKIGFGTQQPLAKLDIRGGNILIKNLTNTTGESVPMIMQSLSFGNYTTFGTSINSSTESADHNSYALQFLTQETHATGLVEKMRVSANGNVGIGTATPQEKLSVNGKIRAHEVKVQTSNWPDYVFEESYKPRTLEEIEKFVRVNKHLPEVPSAKVVEKEGISLGEMNKILLKKIEELTLLLIEQNKKNEQQDKLIETLLKEQK